MVKDIPVLLDGVDDKPKGLSSSAIVSWNKARRRLLLPSIFMQGFCSGWTGIRAL
jgi:hypothetical protein